jgi:hypothetical protein
MHAPDHVHYTVRLMTGGERRRRVLCLSTLACALGCGSSANGAGDDNLVTVTPVSPATIAIFEGTYALESFTVNPTACDVEGPAETSAHAMTFVMAGGPDPMPARLALVACADEVECMEQVAESRAGGAISGEYVLLLSDQVSDSVLRSVSSYPGRFADGICTERKWYASELTRSGNTVRAETRTILLDDRPANGDVCSSLGPAALAREAEGRPCSALRVISGTKVGPLPG